MKMSENKYTNNLIKLCFILALIIITISPFLIILVNNLENSKQIMFYLIPILIGTPIGLIISTLPTIISFQICKHDLDTFIRILKYK